MVKRKAVTRYRTRTVRARPRRHARKTVSVAKVIGFSAAVGTPLYEAYSQGGTPQEIAQNSVQNEVKAFTGYDMASKSWNFADVIPAYAEIGLGYGAHWLANKMGINRFLKKYKI
jgi:hypothetical protein